MENNFSQSFGKPFVSNYIPPDCAEGSNKVLIILKIQSKGKQFGRLAVICLRNNEVFRNATAESTRSGIEWEYEKDMSAYMALWKITQKLIFDLPNRITANLIVKYNTTLIATYLTVPGTQTTNSGPGTADMIIPISSRMGINASSPSAFNVPTANATTTVSFPHNAARAIFSLSSTGQGNEEFWWSNFLQSEILTFGPSTHAFGNFPFREVQVHIDEQIAGVRWPFPIIFTRGVAPGLWSPVVWTDAFDLKEYGIDIPLWLSRLCDGNMHTFIIKVVGLEDHGKNGAILSEMTGSSWVVIGNVYVLLDNEGSIATGSDMSIETEPPTIAVSQSSTTNSTGENETLRSGTVSQLWKFPAKPNLNKWNRYFNWVNLLLKQILIPLFANTKATNTPDGNVTFLADTRQSKSIIITGTSVFPSPLEAVATYTNNSALVSEAVGRALTTTQNETATLFQSPSQAVSTSFGSTSQEMRLGAVSKDDFIGMQPGTELYYRSIAAVNVMVKNDVQSLVGEDLEA